MFINTISASKSDIIDQCLWKYYLKYVLKIPGFESKNEDSLNFGSFIHKVFEIGYKEKDLKSLVKLAESLKPTYKIPFSEKSRLHSCLENFLSWNLKLGETVSTEWRYEVYLDKNNDIKANGVIDRIIKGFNNGYLVIDYKSSKREKKKKDLLTDKQLMGYAYAIHTTYNIPYSQIWCAHYYPVTGNFIPVQFVEFQIKGWMRKEIDKVWRIRKKKKDPAEFPAQSNTFCDYCEMHPVCEKKCSKQEVAINLEKQIALKARLDEEAKAKDQVKTD